MYSRQRLIQELTRHMLHSMLVFPWKCLSVYVDELSCISRAFLQHCSAGKKYFVVVAVDAYMLSILCISSGWFSTLFFCNLMHIYSLFANSPTVDLVTRTDRHNSGWCQFPVGLVNGRPVARISQQGGGHIFNAVLDVCSNRGAKHEWGHRF